MFVFAFANFASVHAAGSANGLLYYCDFPVLGGLCQFVASEANEFGAEPHTLDRSVGENGFREVVDLMGSPLSLTPRPWTEGDTVVGRTTQLSDELTAYSLAFDLIAPLRNGMMYPHTDSTPTALVPNLRDANEWAKWTKAFVDCKIKVEDEEGDHLALSRDNVYEKFVDPAGVDVHHNILQFLEEGAIDLVCLMAPSLVMDRCDVVRAKQFPNDETAAEWCGETGTCTCWKDAYTAIYGDFCPPSGCSAYWNPEKPAVDTLVPPADPTTETEPADPTTETEAADQTTETEVAEVPTEVTTAEDPCAEQVEGFTCSPHHTTQCCAAGLTCTQNNQWWWSCKTSDEVSEEAPAPEATPEASPVTTTTTESSPLPPTCTGVTDMSACPAGWICIEA